MEDNKGLTAPIAPVSDPSTPVTQPAASPETKPDVEARFAHLARKERQLRQQARQLEQKRREIEELSRPKPPPAPTVDDFRSKLLEDPTSLGLSYDQLAQLVLNQGNPQDQTMKSLQREISALRAEQEAAKKAAAESQENSYKQALKQVERDVRRIVESNKDFETIKTAGQHEAVVSLIEQTFKEDGVLLGVEEAAQAIEEQLLEHAVSLAKLEKVRAKLTPAQAAAQEAAKGAPASEAVPSNLSPELAAALKQAQDQKKRRITITNRLQTESSQGGSSDRDRIARAIAAAQGIK